ncbi:RNase H domain-containing protein [Trichonephila clavipes]|nr:RNase H domain-containing protein [Trichonephila clavipes]
MQGYRLDTSLQRFHCRSCRHLPCTSINRLQYAPSTVAPVVFQRVFAYHRSQYSRYSAIYTDGSKRADYVGCGVVIEDIMHGYRLDTSCSIFTAEAVAIYRALQSIDSTMPRKYCIYTDSMSVLEALENYHDRCHPVVCTILDITSRLYSKGFDIVFCWLPSHVGIIGNEQADSAAKSATTHLPLAVPLSDMKRVILHHIFKIWQESWSPQLDNKLHSVKPVIGAWPVMPMRRTDVKLTRLRIGHTRFTHRHLLFGERAPECPSCNVSYTESWSQQLDNKLHSVKPVVGAWPVMSMRRTDVKLTRLRIGHTRFTHMHLLLAKFGSGAIKPNNHSLTHSITSNSTSSSTTQANLLPSASSIKPTTKIASRLPKPISSAAAPDNILNTSASSLSAETRTLIRSNKSAACGVQLKFNPYQNLTLLHPMVNILMHLKSHSVQNEIQEIEESVQKYRKQKLKSKWITHRPQKSTPTESTTDEDDMIMYDVVKV